MPLPKICGKNGMSMDCNAMRKFIGSMFATAPEATVRPTMVL
jgi:hypothetical protein